MTPTGSHEAAPPRRGAPALDARLARGLAAGVIGTAVLAASDRLERIALGRRPVYSHLRIGRRLARRYLSGSDRAWDSRLGIVLRWSYGPALGAAFGALRPLFPRTRLGAALVLSAGIAAVELALFPLLGATPPVRGWPPGQRRALLLHTSAYALAAALAYPDVSRRPSLPLTRPHPAMNSATADHHQGGRERAHAGFGTDRRGASVSSSA